MEARDLAETIMRRVEAAGFSCLFVGGCVRDKLLNIPPRDFDVATDAQPDEILEIFAPPSVTKTSKLKAIPTGVEYGTITIASGKSQVEITTLRKDIKTFGRQAEVRFGTSFKEDALRRDFTINGLFEDRLGHIYDFTGGYQDLKNKKLRFIGEAEKRIKEDFLRILRFFRFWARTEFSVEKRDLVAIKRCAPGLAQISAERIVSELMATFAHPKSSRVIPAMIEANIFALLWPELNARNIVFDTDMNIFDNFIAISQPRIRALARLSLLYCHNSLPLFLKGLDLKDLINLGKRLKIAKKETAQLEFFFSCFRRLALSESQADIFEFIAYANDKLGDKALLFSVLDPLLHIIYGYLNDELIASHSFYKKVKYVCGKIISGKLIEKKLDFLAMPISNADIIDELNKSGLPVKLTATIFQELTLSYWNENWHKHDEGINQLRTCIEQYKKTNKNPT